nr:ribosome small subunit-dependent GTPase A [Priestia megaterium]
MNDLVKLGWEESSSPSVNLNTIARVITVQRNSYRISDGRYEYIAHVSGKFFNEVNTSMDFPAVGDWVVVEKLIDEKKAVIKELLPRKTQFVRQAAGDKTEAQLVAANLDTIFIVGSLNDDLNVRRMERYIISAYESGASPVIVLTKKDMCKADEIATIMSELEEVAIGIPIVTLSSITGEGITEFMSYLPPRKTAALLGSSGVGKSTLVNVLLEEQVQLTNAIRENDSKGRHTTTHREMFLLKNGGLLIDTPGMRELQLWEGEHAIDTAFEDIEAFVTACYFTDCKHDTEPGCRVKDALNSGELSEARFQSYLKLQRELAYEKRKQDQKAQLEEKNKWKQLTKNMKTRYKNRRYK